MDMRDPFTHPGPPHTPASIPWTPQPPDPGHCPLSASYESINFRVTQYSSHGQPFESGYIGHIGYIDVIL